MTVDCVVRSARFEWVPREWVAIQSIPARDFVFLDFKFSLLVDKTVDRTIGPSLREPNRAEWRATNPFLSANKKPNYYSTIILQMLEESIKVSPFADQWS